ncbi:MAG: hypothetical protein JXA28_01030 [Bacteroidetes bacterium]|nr:hypothetical protein [Bacteroidota bacterium]
MRRIPLLSIAIVAMLCTGLGSDMAYGQSSPGGHRAVRRDAFFFELAGQSRGLTVNYERKMFDTEPHNLSLRVGWGIGWSIPLTASYLLGRDHKLELSAGWLYQLGTKTYGSIFPTVSEKPDEKWNSKYVSGFIGYRYENGRGSFLFRAGYTPLYRYSGTHDDKEFISTVGISIGWAFR